MFVFVTTDGEIVTLSLETNRFTDEQLDIYLSEETSSAFWGENPYYFPNQKTLYLYTAANDEPGRSQKNAA